jgi:hypothetical protein
MCADQTRPAPWRTKDHLGAVPAQASDELPQPREQKELEAFAYFHSAGNNAHHTVTPCLAGTLPFPMTLTVRRLRFRFLSFLPLSPWMRHRSPATHNLWLSQYSNLPR